MSVVCTKLRACCYSLSKLVEEKSDFFFLPVFVQTKVHTEESASTKFLSRSACSAVCKVDIHQTILYTVCQVGMQGASQGRQRVANRCTMKPNPFWSCILILLASQVVLALGLILKTWTILSFNRRRIRIQIRFLKCSGPVVQYRASTTSAVHLV